MNKKFEQYKNMEAALLKKWDTALNAFGGVKNEHMAKTTAILLENYLNHVNADPRLIAEDKIGTGAFTGVNLALVGLIRRAIPELVGAELVGIQAMPTPKSPIFTMLWQRDNVKGSEPGGTQFWGSYGSGSIGEDAYYSSSEVRNENKTVGASTGNVALVWGNDGNAGDPVGGAPNAVYVMPSSVYLRAIKSDGTVLDTVYFPGTYSAVATAAVQVGTAGGKFDVGALTFEKSLTNGYRVLSAGSWYTSSVDVDHTEITYEYDSGCEDNIPEMSFTITETTVDLIRRQLRGRYCLDAEFDLKAYHGINLESEMMEAMKLELTNGINREIVDDLRKMAATTRTIDFNAAAFTNVTSGNYDDYYKAILDGISQLSAIIWNETRLGYGNFVVGNPETLAFLDRVPGFMGAGTSYDGKGMAFAGSLGGRIKVYKDPQYPKNELLVGYKGPGALDTGYIHAPYLPITATPTMHNQLTGDPIKLFYTRYGKTWRDRGGENGGPKQALNRGEYCYARLKLVDFPSIFA